MLLKPYKAADNNECEKQECSLYGDVKRVWTMHIIVINSSNVFNNKLIDYRLPILGKYLYERLLFLYFLSPWKLLNHIGLD